MEVDESFRRPGAIPFKWEIRPGVPKVQHRHQQPDNRQRSSTNAPQKLRPPPSSPRSGFLPPPEFRTGSFRSVPRTRSERWSFNRPEVLSVGCFPGPLLSRKDSKKRIVKPERMRNSDLEILTKRSVSVRRARSPFTASPTSSYSSFGSSPRPVSDAEWGGVGLFYDEFVFSL